ncbi:MAG: tetratricopeptide repeat protein [Gemmatimonadetes bacterium]|nr:tetratricopeptide repeat protein [Gemmatimonadota bacterium]NNK62692.1 tetratricopeptide repeat protein [Gemmatimonadota bacterium]
MAQRHPGSSRRRPGDSKNEEADDVFIARVLEFTGWARNNSQVLILFGIAVAAVIFAAVYYANWRGTQAETAIAELERIAQSVGISDPEASKISLEQYLERFAGTAYAGEARLLLAQLYMDGGQAGQALTTLEAAGESLREPMGVQLATLQARALEEQQRTDEAEALYLRIADDAELAFQRVAALDDAARLRMERSDYAGAAALYQRLIDGEDASVEQLAIYEMRLGEAMARQGG